MSNRFRRSIYLFKYGRYKKFEELTKDEKTIICNGCGGKGSWIKPPHSIFFKACCDRHDYGYWKGLTDNDRLKCDRTFYSAMLDDCNKLSWYEYLRYRPWCWLYYIAVRLKGKKYFNFTEVP